MSETEVSGKAVWKGKELRVEGVKIPKFSYGLVGFLSRTGLLSVLKKYLPNQTGWLCRIVIGGAWTRGISTGHWYLYQTLGKPGLLKAVKECSSKDLEGIVYFLRKPGCISNTWIMSAEGDAKLIKMVSKRYGSNGVAEFEKKPAEELVQILKVLHSQASQSDRAWPGLKRKGYEPAKAAK
ncbi:MAG: hypothetical protein HYX90_05220 [Chloroflexi bacterium]|nr:hypothetical protein [Chloroflexota bacterium]